MSILSTWYDCFLLLEKAREEHLWSKDLWINGFDHMDDAIQLTRGPNTKIEHDGIRKLGALRWNRKSIGKWAISPTSQSDDDFHSISIWCPSASIVDKEQLGPDAFICVSKLLNKHFTEAILICVAKNFKNNVLFTEHAYSFISQVITNSSTSILLKSERPWGKLVKENIRNQMPSYINDIDSSLKAMSEFDHEKILGKWNLL